MENYNPKMIEKARTAKTSEELLTMAKEAGMEDFTEESAKAYFDLLHPTTGEVADEELANVTGGGCYNKGELVVTPYTAACSEYRCKYCNRTYAEAKSISKYALGWGWQHGCGKVNGRNRGAELNCSDCKYCEYKRGLWLCTNPNKRK